MKINIVSSHHGRKLKPAFFYKGVLIFYYFSGAVENCDCFYIQTESVERYFHSIPACKEFIDSI